jgi:tRNA pseudouridine38-40 synthase
MVRVAVKFAYDGTRFMGSQRQPGERTAESELLRALIKIGAITSADENRFRVASRTDRGVSALGNVFAVDTDFRLPELLAALNASCEDVHCFALAEVPKNFSPRRAQGRWYRYHLPYRGQDLDLMAQGANEFKGEHEFRLFCKPDGKVTLRALGSVSLCREGELIVIDIRAREFLRNMVRRIVSALDQLGQGKVTLEDIRSALQGQGRSMGLADAEGLVLMDIDLDLDWCYPPTGRMPSIVSERTHKARVRLRFEEALLEKSSLASRFPGNDI